MDKYDLVCFSHLRWNFVFQRPQHLLTRFALERRVFYVEEAIFSPVEDHNQVTLVEENLWVIVPHLNNADSELSVVERLSLLMKNLVESRHIDDYIFWYYTPMSLEFTKSLTPKLVVYDCMDELSAFKFAPPELKENETQLFQKADIVFTGGHSLFEAKKNRHNNIFPFPSSIDKNHFNSARTITVQPSDQEAIPHPRIGFYGVIDERMDIKLIADVAEAHPEWHFVIIGPVVKIDQATLPRFDNIHYLGGKSYQELPTYLAGWDIAIIPFEINESTRFISPTKTPEYLAAGKPVISSSIQDVITPYGENKLVHIADSAEEFTNAVELQLKSTDTSLWLSKVDAFLENNSWDNTWNQMMQHIEKKLKEKEQDIKVNKLNSKEYIYV